VNRWDVLAAICDRLAAGFLDRTGSPPAALPSWETLIEASSHQLVTPALAWSMREADCPPDIHDYFDAVLTLNRSRNQTLLATLSRVTGVLNGLGIEPVLLKGAAHLATGLYPDPGVRIVGDIDLLVPAERAADAAAMLGDIGFDRAGPTPLVAVAMHHLPTLGERETGVALELHTEVVVKSHAAFLPVPWFLAGTEPLAFEGLRCRVPDATRTVAHTIVHSELQNHGYRYGTVRLGRSSTSPSSVTATIPRSTGKGCRLCSTATGRVMSSRDFSPARKPCSVSPCRRRSAGHSPTRSKGCGRRSNGPRPHGSQDSPA